MAVSRGAGFCDCGDTEAWTSYTHCSNHMVQKKPEDADKVVKYPDEELPEDLKKRTNIVFASVLGYCIDILATMTYMNLPKSLDVSAAELQAHRQQQQEEGQGQKEEPQPQQELFEDVLSSLDSATPDELFSTVIYNDEDHTFDDVIMSLCRAVDCDKESAKAMANAIDKEGRCVVKCGDFQICNEVKSIIERITSRQGRKPLRVFVIHNFVMAHQIAATRLLDWLKYMVQSSDAMLTLFAKVLLDRQRSSTIRKIAFVDTIFISDTISWKSVRKQFHGLVVLCMLFDQNLKKQFAAAFTRCYGTIMKDFLNDDHEHTFSIHSLSIQMFIVPSLAHYLVAQEEALCTLVNTFMSECDRWRAETGKLEFQRNLNVPQFHRTEYILHDINYLLRSLPDSWTDQLRRGFLSGVSLFLKIVQWMQGMDPQLRQQKNHVEYEIEWRTAFKLFFCVSPIINAVYAWAITDKAVFIRVTRCVLKKLYDDMKQMDDMSVLTNCKIGDHDAECISYKVDSQPVSIHCPLTRLLGALSLSFQKFDLNFESHQFQHTGEVITPAQLMEPSLRVFVFIAQSRAAMWRRNGFSIQDQIRNYMDPKRRADLFDRDLVMVQNGAAMLDPDEFLIHLLNKFRLLTWINEDYNLSEEDIRRVTTLVEELLNLIIYVISERYMPGVGEIEKRDCLKREIIQILCVDSMPHWTLNRYLPEDSNSNTGLETVVESVANFVKPSSEGTQTSGKYELKDQFLDQYNVFYYHYSKEDHSKSESRLLGMKKAKNLPEVNPPPKLPAFTSQYKNILRLLSADVFHTILSRIMTRAEDLHNRCFSENQVHRALHLMGVALNEIEGDSNLGPAFFATAKKFNIYNSLQQVRNSQRISGQKALLEWVIQKWHSVAAKAGSGEEIKTEGGDEGQQNADSEEAEKKRRRELAKARRAKLMQQMKSAQTKFATENKEEYATVVTVQNETRTSFSKGDDSNTTIEESETSMKAESETFLHQCILCQEEEDISNPEAPCMIMTALAQRSSVLSQVHRSTNLLDSPYEDRPPFLPSDLRESVFLGSCGHIMHWSCFCKHFDDLQIQERRRHRIRQPRIFDVSQGEFCCPLCGRLSNVAIPLAPKHREKTEGNKEVSSDEKFTTSDVLNVIKNIKNLEYLSEYSKFAAKISECRIDSPMDEMTFPLEYLSAVESFTKQVFKVISVKEFNTANPLMWQTTAYTIQSAVLANRHNQKKSIATGQLKGISELVNLCLISLSRVVNADRKEEDKTKEVFGLLLGNNDNGLSLLDVDAFGLLVSLVFSMVGAFGLNEETGNEKAARIAANSSILEIVLVFHFIQILMSNKEFLNNSKIKEDDETASAEEKFIRAVSKMVQENTNQESLENVQPSSRYVDTLKTGSLHFLRCAQMFFNLIHQKQVKTSDEEEIGEFEFLLSNLGIDEKSLWNPEETLKNAISKWISKCSKSKKSTAFPIKIKPLISLPKLYTDNVNAVSQFTCSASTSQTPSRVPVKCLICGEILCAQSMCCQFTLPSVRDSGSQQQDPNDPEREESGEVVGACTAHAENCGKGVGIFLRIRENRIMLVSGRSKGCFLLTPYYDKFGEPDTLLRRGYPLYLNEEKYKKIKKLWINHEIPEKIAYLAENNVDFVNTPWQNM